MESLSFTPDVSDGIFNGTHLDLSTVRSPNLEQKRVNVDLQIWMLESLDEEAGRVGVTRQSIINVWLAERLKVKRSAETARTTLRP